VGGRGGRGWAGEGGRVRRAGGGGRGGVGEGGGGGVGGHGVGGGGGVFSSKRVEKKRRMNEAGITDSRQRAYSETGHAGLKEEEGIGSALKL